MKRTTIILLMVCLCLVSAQAQTESIVEHPEVASSLKLLSAWIEGQIEERDLAGVSIGIVHDQKLIWAQGFGYSDLKKKIPASPKTIYRIASITKTFTATAIMQLRDEGKLQLDDPITKYLPWFKINNRHPDAPDITIRHLLTHTSGLPRESAFPYWTEFEFPTRKKMIEALHDQETIYASETKWKYSNLAFSLAGEIVAAVSGEAYEDYISNHILKPLKMTSTSLNLPKSDQKRLAVPYGKRKKDGTRDIDPMLDLKAIAPAGAMNSTVEDLAKYLAFHLSDGKVDGHEILNVNTLKEMHRVHWLHPSWESGWGLGFNVLHYAERDLIGHGGGLPGYESAINMSPNEGIAVIVLANAADSEPYAGTPYSITDRAFEWIVPAIAEATASPTIAKKAGPGWERYEGKYRDRWGVSQVLILHGELVMIDPAAQNPMASIRKLLPEGENTFRIDGGSFYDNHGELVVFEMGSSGKVSRVKVGENYAYPVK